MAFRASRASSFILRAQTVLVCIASRAGIGPSLAVKDAITAMVFEAYVERRCSLISCKAGR
jgi:hypothetical protein